MIKEIKLSALNNIVPKVNKKEPPRTSPALAPVHRWIGFIERRA